MVRAEVAVAALFLRETGKRCLLGRQHGPGAGRDQQRYAALQAVFLPGVHRGTAARAMMGVHRRQLEAGVT